METKEIVEQAMKLNKQAESLMDEAIISNDTGTMAMVGFLLGIALHERAKIIYKIVKGRNDKQEQKVHDGSVVAEA